MASQPNRASSSTSPPSSPNSLYNRLDHIDIPYDLDALAQSQTSDQALDLPSRRTPDNPHPFGILNSVHLRRLAGRDAKPRPTMQPAMPARVTRRNDFPTVKAVKAAASNSNSSSNNDNNSNNTPAEGPAAAMDRNRLNEIVHRVMKPTFPPHLEGVVETRHRSDAKMTENLRGFGEDVEDMVGAKAEYGRRYRAVRAALLAAEGALAGKARQLRAARGAAAGEVRRALGGRGGRAGGGGGGGEVTGAFVARVEGLHGRVRTLAAHMGFVFALGRAVDQAALPGENFGKFDETECSPKAYLSLHFPEFARRRPAAAADPMAPELPPPHLLPLFFPAWDFSLEELLRGEKRARLRALWEAAVVGDWEAVEQMTRGEIVAAEALVAVGVGVDVGAGDGDDEDGIESV